MVKLIVDGGCDVRLADKAGFTALHHAAFGASLGGALYCNSCCKTLSYMNKHC